MYVFILWLLFFLLMIRRPPRSTRTEHSFPTRRSSDLVAVGAVRHAILVDAARFERLRIGGIKEQVARRLPRRRQVVAEIPVAERRRIFLRREHAEPGGRYRIGQARRHRRTVARPEEHTSELQSLMRNSYAVFCLKKKNQKNKNMRTNT